MAFSIVFAFKSCIFVSAILARSFSDTEPKMQDLNANTIEKAVEMIRGTARSMGIEVS